MSTQAVKQHLEAAGRERAEQKQSLLIEDDERWYSILDAAFDPKVRLHRLDFIDGDLSTSSSTDEMNSTAGGEDCGDSETTSKTSQDDSHSSETEVCDYYYEDNDGYYDNYGYDDDDVSNPESQLKRSSETGPKTEHRDEQNRSTNTVEPFSCSECGKQFVNKQLLQNHVSSHARRSPISFVGKKCFSANTVVDSCRTVQAVLNLYRCDDDIRDSNSKTDIGKQIHPVNKPFKCDVCERSYTNKGNLNRHMKEHTENQLFGCDVREQSHCSKEKPLHCDMRQQIFREKNAHMRSRKGKKPFECDECERSYWNKESLTRHMKDHTEKQLFRCDVRERSDGSESNLSRNTKDHAVKKLFRCDVCKQGYSNQSNLTRHMKVHTEKQLFRCDVREQSDGGKSNLSRRKKGHTVKKLFRCDVCERSFCSKGSLTKHMMVHIVKLFRCDVCDLCYCSKGSLTRHMMVHKVGTLPS